MYNTSDELKKIYKNDILPVVSELTEKDIVITFADLGLTIGIDQFAVDKGDFELHESICMDDQLKFGKCNASQVKFTLADVTDDIKGREFGITQTVIVNEETSYPMPLGFFTVDSAPKEDDLRFKDITAYDRMRRIDTDVSTWYNGLFPTGDETYTLAQFRASFLAFVGLTEDTSRLPLPNDSMTVPKTIDPTQLSGRTVIECCEELNGCFGLMGRDGKFNHIILKPMYHDYPQSDYPEADYPEAEPYDEYIDNYQGIRFEEYRVQPIDKIQIRQEENDIGAIYGAGTNCYIIQGNFLVYGKSASELQTIAQNASVNIFDRGYRPYEATGQGLPYIMPGDFIKYNADDTTVGYVFERTLTGLQALQDEYSAKGSEIQKQSFGVNDEIIQLKGKAAKIEKSIEGVRVAVTDLDKQLTGDINVLAGQIVLKVDTAGNIGFIDLNGDPDTGLTGIEIKASNINLNGYVGINGSVVITDDGKLHAVDANFSGTVESSIIKGSEIVVEGDSVIHSTDWDGTTYGADFNEAILSNGIITVKKTRYIVGGGTTTSLEGTFGGGVLDTYKVECTILGDDKDYIDIAYISNINNGVPITSANIASQTVNYALTAGSVGYASMAGQASYAVSAGSSGSSNGVGAGGSLGLFNISVGGGYISYGGNYKDSGYSYIGMNTIQATNIQNLSMRESKDHIELFAKSAIELIYNTPIYNYTYKNDEEEGNKVHVGVITDEAPDDILGSGGKTVSLYDMISVGWKGEQELYKLYLDQRKDIYNLNNNIDSLKAMIEKLKSD